jgi:hypothetical protein
VILVFGLAAIIGISSSKPFFFSESYPVACIDKKQCAFTFEIKEDVSGPIYIYSHYRDFFVNHRNVVKNVSKNQISGDKLSGSDLTKRCPGMEKNKEKGVTLSHKGEALNPDDALSPCGIYPTIIPNEDYTLIMKATGSDAKSLVRAPADK